MGKGTKLTCLMPILLVFKYYINDVDYLHNHIAHLISYKRHYQQQRKRHQQSPRKSQFQVNGNGDNSDYVAVARLQLYCDGDGASSYALVLRPQQYCDDDGDVCYALCHAPYLPKRMKESRMTSSRKQKLIISYNAHNSFYYAHSTFEHSASVMPKSVPCYVIDRTGQKQSNKVPLPAN